MSFVFGHIMNAVMSTVTRLADRLSIRDIIAMPTRVVWQKRLFGRIPAAQPVTDHDSAQTQLAAPSAQVLGSTECRDKELSRCACVILDTDGLLKRSLLCHKPRVEGATPNAKTVSPFWKGFGLPLKRDFRHHHAIAALLGGRGPAAVARAITATRVYPVNAVPRRRSRPHVGHERPKIMPPPSAHANTLTTVTVVVRNMAVFTPCDDVAIDLIKRMVALAIRASASAPETCFAAAGQEPLSNYDLSSTAVALAQAGRLTPTAKLGQHQPLVESLADKRLMTRRLDSHLGSFGDGPTGTLIGSLYLLGGPSAILGRIWAIVVDPVYRMNHRWAFAHISGKVCERLAPPVADTNRAFWPATVAIVIRVIRVVTPALHCGPYAIKPALATAMSGRTFAAPLRAETPTAFKFPGTQVTVAPRKRCSAVAAAQPTGAAVGANIWLQDRQPANAHAGKNLDFSSHIRTPSRFETKQPEVKSLLGQHAPGIRRGPDRRMKQHMVQVHPEMHVPAVVVHGLQEIVRGRVAKRDLHAGRWRQGPEEGTREAIPLPFKGRHHVAAVAAPARPRGLGLVLSQRQDGLRGAGSSNRLDRSRHQMALVTGLSKCWLGVGQEVRFPASTVSSNLTLSPAASKVSSGDSLAHVGQDELNVGVELGVLKPCEQHGELARRAIRVRAEAEVAAANLTLGTNTVQGQFFDRHFNDSATVLADDANDLQFAQEKRQQLAAHGLTLTGEVTAGIVAPDADGRKGVAA